MQKSSKIYHVSWSYDFELSVGQLWNAMSDTDRLNQGLGLPHVSYQYQPRAEGGVETVASFKLKGLVIRWREHPYEWVKEKYFEIERDYFSGPMKNVVIRWEIEARPGGGSTLRQKIRYTLKHWAFLPVAVFQFQVEAKLKVFGIYKRLNRQAALKTKKSQYPKIDLKSSTRLDRKSIKRWVERMRQNSIDELRSTQLLDWLQASPPTDLIKIRPYRLAKSLGWNSDETLSILIKAARAGALNLNWGLLCPGCRGTKLKKASLAELPDHTHCNTCNIRFEPDFSKQVELTFRVASSICETSDLEFCAGGPQNTPHSLVQLRLKPGQTLKETLSIEPGTYMLRSLQSPVKMTVNFHPSAETTNTNLVIQFHQSGLNSAKSDITDSQLHLTLKNDHPFEIVVVLEQAEWMNDVCSAFQVVNTKEFRDLFPTQVISKSIEFRVSSLTILFTDLKDSTSMYEKIGDAQALDVVVAHLEKLESIVAGNGGFVVKTIGDAVMAVFQQPEQAVQAALDIQNFYLAESKSDSPSDLHVKIGIHKGPCFAVNLNERNDFFGGTVNIAARTASKSGSDEIVMTGKMIDDPGVKDLLRKHHCQVHQMIVPLKGLTGEYELYELKLSA